MARNIERRDVLKGIGGTGLVGLAGCISQSGGDDEGTGTSDGTDTSTSGGGGGGGSDFEAKLGVLLPLTGDLASVGKPIRDAAILPKKVLDQEDIPITIDQSVKDTQTDPQAAVNTANSLVNGGYPMVTGPASSGVNMQVTQEAFIPNSVVGCSPSSTSPNVTGLDDNDLIFRTAPSDALQGQVMAQVGTEEISAKSASVMFVNNDYGQALTNSFVDAFKKAGGSTSAEIAFKKEKSSYTSELGKAMNGSPDMLVVIGYPASGIQIFRDFYAEYGEDTDILVTDGLQDGTLPDKVGNDMKNVYGTAPQPSGPGNEAFTKQYKDEYGSAPGVFNAHAYDASAVLLLAATAAGENDGTKIKEQLRNVANPGGKEITPENLAEGITMANNGEEIQYVGASSAVDFDDKGDMKAVAYSYWKFNTSKDSNVESLKTINFGGDS